MANQTRSVFGRARSDSTKLTTVYDAEGRAIEAESREDEEQNMKMEQTVELLVAAGYFRARIKGLTPFDKVVGGMTWCITTCSFDLDVDLLFQENSTIGQKISLTEKIVAVLPRMKCPHRIEPHQIQGLDFINIFPVVQWLVKRAMESRAERGDYIRKFSISQFNKRHKMAEDEAFEGGLPHSLGAVKAVKELYKPVRKYKRHQSGDASLDEETKVQSTLLEYGKKHAYTKEHHVEETTDDQHNAAAEASLEALRAEEEQKIEALMSAMAATKQGDKLTASAVGLLVGRQQAEIAQIASDYAERQAELEASVERDMKVSGAQQHKRQMAALTKQTQILQSRLDDTQKQHDQLHEAYLSTETQLNETQAYSAKIDAHMQQLEELESDDNKEILQKLRSLVAMNESLKAQELDFKAHCKSELQRLKDSLESLKTGGDGETGEDEERTRMINEQYLADKEKMHKIKLLLARKTREIAVLQRKIDEVPSRAELSQYQKRFIELYNQMSATHKETKQFYTLYNTLDDMKLYLNKEVNLLNSIHDNFTPAMASRDGKEQFLKQFELIVEGVKQNRIKCEKKKQEEKMKRDLLNDQHLDIVEKQRLYFKTVKEFKEECRKNEILLSKLKNES